MALAQKDLDWLAEHHAMESCDLWEETRDADFLWNRVVHLSALVEGSETISDVERQQRRDAFLPFSSFALEISKSRGAEGWSAQEPRGWRPRPCGDMILSMACRQRVLDELPCQQPGPGLRQVPAPAPASLEAYGL